MHETYLELRPHMFAIAYRMLGSVAEAEDIVQDAYVRLQRTEADEVDSPRAFATTVITRLAIDSLRSARVRRESYVGTWLPEPILTAGPGQGDDPADVVERAATVSMGMLVMLERLNPVERAVFILREAFGYDYADIATVVGKSEANCRQVFSRARRRLDDGAPRFVTSRKEQQALAERFFDACRDGDTAALRQLLADDIVFYGDGGGKAPAVRVPVTGALHVGRFLLGLLRQVPILGVRIEPVEVNGEPGARVVDAQGQLVNVLSLEIADGRVRAIRSVLNPDKLAHLGPVASVVLGPPG